MLRPIGWGHRGAPSLAPLPGGHAAGGAETPVGSWLRRSRSRTPTEGDVSTEVKQLIRRMAEANPTWGAPKIHGELLKLGIVISE